MAKKQNKKSEKVITHPVMTISELRKNAQKLDKKSHSGTVKPRIIELLKSNSKNDIGLTQRQIRDNLNNEVREQHINNVLHALLKDGKIERYKASTICDDGIVRDLMYNVWIG